MPISTVYKTISPEQLMALQVNGYSELSLDFKGQQNMYLKLHKSYAEMIARQWHLPLYGSAFIVQLSLPSVFLKQFPVETFGYREHCQYCIPAADLHRVNGALVGKVIVEGGIVHHRLHQAKTSQPLMNMVELDMIA